MKRSWLFAVSFFAVLVIIFAAGLAAAEIQQESKVDAAFVGEFYAGDVYMNKRGFPVGKLTGINTTETADEDHPVWSYINSWLAHPPAAGTSVWMAFPDEIPTGYMAKFTYTLSGGEKAVAFVEAWFASKGIPCQRGKVAKTGLKVKVVSSSGACTFTKTFQAIWVKKKQYGKIDGWYKVIALDHLNRLYLVHFDQDAENISLRPKAHEKFSAYTVAGLVFKDPKTNKLRGMVQSYNGSSFPPVNHPVYAYVRQMLLHPPAKLEDSWKIFGYYSDEFQPCPEDGPCLAPPRMPLFTVKSSGNPSKVEAFVAGYLRYYGYPCQEASSATAAAMQSASLAGVSELALASFTASAEPDVYHQLAVGCQLEDYRASLVEPSLSTGGMVTVTITSAYGGSKSFSFPANPVDPDSYVLLDDQKLDVFVALEFMKGFDQPFSVLP